MLYFGDTTTCGARRDVRMGSYIDSFASRDQYGCLSFHHTLNDPLESLSLLTRFRDGFEVATNRQWWTRVVRQDGRVSTKNSVWGRCPVDQSLPSRTVKGLFILSDGSYQRQCSAMNRLGSILIAERHIVICTSKSSLEFLRRLQLLPLIGRLSFKFGEYGSRLGITYAVGDLRLSSPDKDRSIEFVAFTWF